MNEIAQRLVKRFGMVNVPYPTRNKKILKHLDHEKSYVGYVGKDCVLLVQDNRCIFSICGAIFITA
jgi:hypothetical protein